jgi:ribosomal protein S18 acetylase RimI-like enzyme
VAAAGAGRTDADAVPVSGELVRIQEAVRADAVGGRSVERVGPFVATFTASSANPFLNYAIPDAGARPSPEEVDALVACFRSRGLTPRLEFVPELAPAVEPALLESGFAVELRTPLMVFGGGVDALPEPEGVSLVDVESREDAYATGVVMNEAYDGDGPPADAWVDGVLQGLDAGALRCLARDAATGEPVGAGACAAPHGSACELHSVGVRTAYRRRGIASAITSRLAHRAATAGTETVFLMAHGEAEARMYERVGFQRVGEVLHISR